MLSTRGITKHKRLTFLAKSDRINALRKQYDMFLEEDKKRKERNDFILGKLDKMRYNTALVPVRHKPNAFETRPPVVDRLGFQGDFSPVRGLPSCITNQLFPDIQVKNNEDSYLIQEISKKYILIPKLRTTFMNNYISNETTNQNPERLQEMHFDQDTVPVKDFKPNTQDQTDWKSKYEILNILKNEEKGKPTENYQTSFVDEKHSVPKESSLENNQDQVAINCDSYVKTDVLVEKPKEYVNEVPEKDLAVHTLHYDLSKNSEFSPNNTVSANENLITNAIDNDISSENNNIIFANVDQTDAINDQLQNITLEDQYSDAPNIGVSPEVRNYYEPQPDVNMTSMMADAPNIGVSPEVTNYYEPQPDVNMTSMMANVGVEQSINEENVTVQEEYSDEAGSLLQGQDISVEQHDPVESEQVLFNNNEISPMQDLQYNSRSDVNDSTLQGENLAQVYNDQEFATNNTDLQMKDDAIIDPETFVNSNIDTPEQLNVYESPENQLNIAESIEDFDVEQREMFYTDPTGKNYTIQQGDVINPGQLSENEYPQNQEYDYYGVNEPEGYPAELNDQEVTQVYDPHYEQQYTHVDDGSEQQQYVEQYEEPEQGVNQANTEFVVPQYEQQIQSQQEVEETLDLEDGYTNVLPPNVESTF